MKNKILVYLQREEEEFNPLTKEKEKLILSDEEESSEIFPITSGLSPIRDKDSFEKNLIIKRKYSINSNNQNRNILKRKRERKK